MNSCLFLLKTLYLALPDGIYYSSRKKFGPILSFKCGLFLKREIKKGKYTAASSESISIHNTELNDLRKIICLRKTSVSVEKIQFYSH